MFESNWRRRRERGGGRGEEGEGRRDFHIYIH
jgi:hypothetical protein